MQINIFRGSLLALALLSGCTSATKSVSNLETSEPESGPEFYVFKAEAGALIVCNESTAHFTIELNSSTFYQGSIEGVAFLLDGHFMNVLTANPRHFESSPLDQQDRIMREYKKWETTYWEEQLDSPIESEQITEVSGTEKGLYLWRLIWPEKWRVQNEVESRGNLYATRMVGDRLVVVVLTLLENTDYSSAIATITGVWQSIIPHESYIDPEVIQENLRKQ